MPPVARLFDYHVCPMVTGKVPHVGGPIVQASGNVKVGGLPAARVGDRAICNGPPDAIAAGTPTVRVNGRPLARLGDPTVHGGRIVGGCGNVFAGTVGGGAGQNKPSAAVTPPSAPGSLGADGPETGDNGGRPGKGQRPGGGRPGRPGRPGAGGPGDSGGGWQRPPSWRPRPVRPPSWWNNGGDSTRPESPRPGGRPRPPGRPKPPWQGGGSTRPPRPSRPPGGGHGVRPAVPGPGGVTRPVLGGRPVRGPTVPVQPRPPSPSHGVGPGATTRPARGASGAAGGTGARPPSHTGAGPWSSSYAGPSDAWLAERAWRMTAAYYQGSATRVVPPAGCGPGPGAATFRPSKAQARRMLRRLGRRRGR